MKVLFRISIVLILTLKSFTAFSVDNPKTDSLNVPENAIIISHTVTLSEIYYTMVDTDTHELLIVHYHFPSVYAIKLYEVFHTGIKINLDLQTKINIDYTPKKE
jgi:hypothetical protein